LRKLIVAALAALLVVGGATAALAQTGGAAMNVTVGPNKAGTKKKPKGTKIRLVLANGNHSLTATQITVLLAKNLKFQTKGFKFCSASTITNSAGTGCPAKSKIGRGSSDAIAGVNTPSGGTPLTFKVTAFLTGKKSLGFYLQQQGGTITALAPGKLSGASGKYGTKLTVTIPTIAKEFPAGVFNGLVKLDTTLGARAGKRNLIGLTGCPKSKKLPFSTTINFQPNPNPPPTPSLTATATAKCRA
jgi:hypothetical protein